MFLLKSNILHHKQTCSKQIGCKKRITRDVAPPTYPHLLSIDNTTYELDLSTNLQLTVTSIICDLYRAARSAWSARLQFPHATAEVTARRASGR